jgi:hypothetical protein
MRLQIEMIEAKAFRTLIRIYSLFKSERLSADIKVTLHKALINFIMTYACPACELVADTYLLKLQCLQSKVFCSTGNFPSCTPVSDFNLLYVYVDITELCRQQAEVIQNHENERVHSIGQDKAKCRKYNSFELGGGNAYDHSSD